MPRWKWGYFPNIVLRGQNAAFSNVSFGNPYSRSLGEGWPNDVSHGPFILVDGTSVFINASMVMPSFDHAWVNVGGTASPTLNVQVEFVDPQKRQFTICVASSHTPDNAWKVTDPSVG